MRSRCRSDGWFNYNKLIKGLDKSTIINIINSGCLCNQEYYRNFKDCCDDHIITGDLDLIKNESLRRIMSRGNKYRKHTKVDKRG